MTKNRLQIELEARRARGPVIDLVDTNFHANGYLFPPEQQLAQWLAEYAKVRRYAPDPRGSAEARAAIAAYYAHAGVPVRPEHVLLTASASESYHLLFHTLAAPGDNVVLPQPGYPLFEYLAAWSRLEVRRYSLERSRGYALDLASVERAIDKRTRFVVLISPNNPTGRVASEAEVAGLLELCRSSGVCLVCDEVFSEFVYEGAYLARPAALSPRLAPEVLVFTLNGVSKMFAAPDLKLGWIAVTGPPQRVEEATERLETANDVYLSCSSLAQFLLPLFFAHAAEFQRAMLARIDESRRLLVEALARVGGASLVAPNGGIHAIVDCGPERPGFEDEELAIELLREEAVYVHPGYLYDIEGRVAFVVSFLKDKASLAEGLRRLVRFLHARLEQP